MGIIIILKTLGEIAKIQILLCHLYTANISKIWKIVGSSNMKEESMEDITGH